MEESVTRAPNEYSRRESSENRREWRIMGRNSPNTTLNERATMRRRSFLYLVMALLLAACAPKPRLDALPAESVVLAFGDSVTYGTGANRGEDWPTLLAATSGWQIVNAGVPGDTAEAAKSRLPALLEEHRPRLVLIELGGNDFLHRRASSAIKQDLQSMIDEIRRSGAQPVLIGIPELSLLAVLAHKPSDASIYAEISEELSVPLVSSALSDVLVRPELCADQIHPNADGYRQMAHAIEAALREYGLLH